MATRSRQNTGTLATVGIDIGKNVFHLVGFDRDGRMVLHRKTKRPERSGQQESHRYQPKRGRSHLNQTIPDPIRDRDNCMERIVHESGPLSIVGRTKNRFDPGENREPGETHKTALAREAAIREPDLP